MDDMGFVMETVDMNATLYTLQPFTTNLKQVLTEMEGKLTVHIKQAITSALDDMRQQFALEIQKVAQMCEQLASRIRQLE